MRVLPCPTRRSLTRLAAVLLFGTALTAGVSAQTCTGDVTVSTQAEVDAFACQVVTGNLVIQGTGIANLAGLSELTSVGGYLQIYDSDQLASLAGLSNLSTLSGDLFIAFNDLLPSLVGLENLTAIGGSLRIGDNSQLASLTGLQNVASIGGHVFLANNQQLLSLAGLQGLSILDDYLFITNNGQLTSLAGLENITRLNGALDLFNNDGLTSLSGLENLTEIGDYLAIRDNDGLTSLAGLENLTRVDEDLFIVLNDRLSACACGLKGLATETSPGTYTFTGVGGDITFTSNGGPACNSAPAVLAEVPACPTPACTDPATAPSYAGGYVLNNAETRAFVKVMAPAGGTVFEFYNTSNLNVDPPETGRNTSTTLGGVTRVGDTFSFSPASPDSVFFPITTAGAGTSVRFFLRVTDACGRTVDVDPAFTLTGTERDEMTGLALASAQPNPVAAQATVRFSVEAAGPVRLAIYDMLGREVVRLVDGMLGAGAHEARFEASELPSGLYMIRLEASGRTLTRTLTIAR